MEFYTAVKDTVQINERELITKLTEMLGNDQYEDWENDMYYELIEEKETKAFVEAFNRAAEKRATYCIGCLLYTSNIRFAINIIFNGLSNGHGFSRTSAGFVQLKFCCQILSLFTGGSGKTLIHPFLFAVHGDGVAVRLHSPVTEMCIRDRENGMYPRSGN